MVGCVRANPSQASEVVANQVDMWNWYTRISEMEKEKVVRRWRECRRLDVEEKQSGRFIIGWPLELGQEDPGSWVLEVRYRKGRKWVKDYVSVEAGTSEEEIAFQVSEITSQKKRK
jgi:hypothetical protein